jgi:hypothetical protein
MGWGFRVRCPDCSREWAGIQTSFRFGRWSSLEDPAIDDGFRSWFCPRCHFRMYTPRTIERNVWRRWYAAFLAGNNDGYPFLRAVAAKLDKALSDGKYYVALPVELKPVDCPECYQAFEESIGSVPDRLVCPHCGRRGAIRNEFESHCLVFRGGHGFD